ncbi:MAG: ribonuclease HII, partial [Desulfovibrionales bacterium]
AGRGSLAGPVVAGAVILPSRYSLPGLTDSKQLTSARRTILAQKIKDQAIAWSLGLSWPPEIDSSDILTSTLAAMVRAVQRLKVQPGSLLVDGNRRVPMPIPQKCFVKGDASVPVISAASILAKTFRDKLLDHLDTRYPGYAFSEHKGYGTRIHLQALKKLGPSPQHRISFQSVDQNVSKGRQAWLPGI